MSAALVAGLATASAQTVAADSVMQHVNGKRLSVGGYGEVAMSRNFRTAERRGRREGQRGD